MVAAVAATGAIVGTGVAVAPAAMASDAFCGSSYNQIWGPHSIYTQQGHYAGDVYLTYSSSTGKNCAYFLISSGTRGSLGYGHSIRIENESNYNSSQPDSGYFEKFAGPVYVYAPNACVKIFASVYSTYDDAQYSSPNLGC
ncbi:hypothetical protein NE236_31860 [Actinoallomurus purpureus]|uniref:hypothetical protein n=1 Tax=Actinoallomurus purpureus TaxID=478114 RepID=UPI002092C489|nr:hypothetical protein [Actinoallomurus purpureus]MCO6009577.1 hypothetical protein [Actinoallomurus purpureus]